MEIGNKISELRKKIGLSQEELADKVGVARQTISKWELGETSPDLKQSKELSKIFKVSLDELTGNDIKDVFRYYPFRHLYLFLSISFISSHFIFSSSIISTGFIDNPIPNILYSNFLLQ